MSFEDERRAIEGRFEEKWANQTKVRWENLEWNEPKEDSSWVSLTIVNVDANQIDLRETALHRFDGLIIIQVFVKKDTGTSEMRKRLDTAASIFRRAQFSKGNSGIIKCRSPFYQRVGESGGWNQTNLTVPFIRDALHSLP